jgi:Cu-Zn family superoxide dismutase
MLTSRRFLTVAPAAVALLLAAGAYAAKPAAKEAPKAAEKAAPAKDAAAPAKDAPAKDAGKPGDAPCGDHHGKGHADHHGKDAKPCEPGAKGPDGKPCGPGAKGPDGKPCEPGAKGPDGKPCCDPVGKPCCDGVTTALAAVNPTAGNKLKGSVRFVEGADGKVTVSVELEGLTPGQQHAWHVHEFGDCSAPDASSAGSHYNPEGHDHGLPEKNPKRHAGDFGNLLADAQGKAKATLVVDNLTVARQSGVVGRSVIVHAKPDDGGQPVGNAGPRLGCGVIGVAKP